MSGFEDGTIIFDEERDIYYAGQVLFGRIEFGLSQPLNFKAITVEFHGEANVRWEEFEVEEYNGVRQTNTVKYSAREEYLNVVHCVCGGVGVSQLAPGSHSIPFRCQIPPTAPSSFRGGDIAEISYWVKASLQGVNELQSAELENTFEVVGPLDLNLIPEVREPVVLEFEEVSGSCLCGSGALGVRVRLPARGFCPGQLVPVDVTVHNRSSVEIRKILIELVQMDLNSQAQREEYRSHRPPSARAPPERVLRGARLGPALPNSKRSVSHQFPMPDVIAPALGTCGIIDVGFFFRVKLKMSGCADDQEDEAEIRLGLVPLYELSQGQYKHPLQSDLPKGPIPNPNAPPEFVLSDIYPSLTLEKGIQPVQVANVSSYPSGNPGNAPYPGFNTPYPGSGYPYAGAQSFPAPVPPYPIQSAAPYPANPPPYSPGPIGFTAPGLASPGYPAGPVPASSPYNPTAPSAP